MKKIIYLLSLIAFVASCDVEDKGSYSYVELNTVNIDSIESSYDKLSLVDTLDIIPELSSTIQGNDLDRYTFHWYLCTGQHVHKTLSTTKDLHYPVDLDAGTYSLYFTVKDKDTDLEWIKSSSLRVSTPYTKGFLLLGEEDSRDARIDMIMMPSGRDTTVQERVYDYTQEGNLKGVEKFIFTGGLYENQALWLITENGSTKLNSSITYAIPEGAEQFSPIGKFEDEELGLFETDAEGIATPMIIKDVFPRPYSGGIRSRSQRGIITEDIILLSQIMQSEYYSGIVNKYSANSTDYFKPYPLAFIPAASYLLSSRTPTVFYDETNQRFTMPNGNGSYAYYSATYCTNSSLLDNAGDPFMWNAKSEGRSIVYGENAPSNYSYTIMKDADDNRFIYQFYIESMQAKATKTGNFQVDFGIAQNFKEASHYTFSGAKTVVVYAVGSTLYAYDFSRQQFTSVDLGTEITCLESEYLSAGRTGDIIVATYDESTHKGTVRKLTVGGGNNAVTLEQRPGEIWDVTMKVIDIEWKNNN